MPTIRTQTGTQKWMSVRIAFTIFGFTDLVDSVMDFFFEGKVRLESDEWN